MTALTIDFTQPKKIKKTYDLKKYDTISVKTGDNEDFIGKIESVTVTGTTLTIKMNGKVIKFKNISADKKIQAMDLNLLPYFDQSLETFYYNPKFENENKVWLSKPSATKVTGTAFGEEIDVSEEYIPTAKNLKKKVGVTINAGGGNDTIIGSNYNDKLTGGAGGDTFVFSKGNGVDTITDATNEDTIEIVDNSITSDDLSFIKNGNNLEIKIDDNNKVIVQNHFKQSNDKKVENLIVNDEELKLSEQSLNIIAKGKTTGTDGDDKFISSTSNDTVTGKGGTNTVIFEGKFGKDTINLTEGENLILDMSGYEDLFDGHVKRSISGSNLILKAYDENNKLYGQVTLKNFAKSDVTGENGSVILRLASGDIDLNKDVFDVYTTKSYTGSRFDEFIDAWDAKKAVTITGGKGNDYIISSQYKPTTFAFASGDGNDRITNTKAGDIIQINSTGEVNYSNNGSDLIIEYGNGDTIQVDGYFSSEDPVIDTIKIKNAQGKYDTKSLAELTNREEVNNKVLNVRINDGEYILPADTEYETINFVGYYGFTSLYTYGPEYWWEGKNDDDLYMPYGNSGDMIVFKDFFKNNGVHNTKHIIVGGETYDLPRRYYTEANDNIIAPQTEDWLYLSGGDHKITFTENNNFHNYDYIYSEGSQYTDTLALSDYSFRNGEIEIGRETGPNGSLVIYANDGIEYDKGGRRNNILYRHYFDESTPLVKIVDKNGTISMARTFATANLDWSTNAEKNNDHVLFVNNNSETTSTTTTVISNTKANQIIVDAYTKEEASAKLNYTYKGGNDIVDTGDYYANDTYNIDSFSATSKLSVLDNGGYADVVNVNANSDDFYLLFDVDNYISVEPNPDEWAIGLVHKDAMTVGTLKKYFTTYYDTDATVAGVLKFDGAGWGNADEESEEWDTSDYGGTIEFIRTNDVADRLDIAAWKKYVAGKVGNWLIDNNFKFSYGSPVRVMEAVGEGKLTLTNAQYQSLLDCYKVKYSELPQSGEFISTTGNDTYNFKEANNTLTFDNAAIGKDTINSHKDEYNASYKDRIIFSAETGYSVKDGTLKVGVNGNDLVINADENNTVTYKNFVSDKTHNDTILTDASNDKYYLNIVESGSNFKKGSNNIAFIYNDKVNNSIATTTGRNFIYSYGEHTYYDNNNTEVIGGMWNCAYVGGEDTVVSYSDKGNDGYEVYKFSKNSKLNVTDNGGAKDSLTIYYNEPKYDTRDALIDETRLVFDVNKSGSIDYSNFMLVYKDALNGNTLYNTTQSDLVAGVLKYNAAPTTADSFGIESLKYYKNDN